MFSASKSGQYQGYQISRSVRLRSSASAYFNRTPAGAGSRTTWTYSQWMKFGAISADEYLFSCTDTSTYNTSLVYTSAGVLRFVCTSGAPLDLITTQVFRDPSAWYHVVLTLDTTQATAANRVRLYINGVQVTAFSTATYPAQNSTPDINRAAVHNIGRYQQGSQYFDGYLTEINFIDGQALTPASFGVFNAYGVWSPTKYNGTYGTNGFYLNFSDPSAATAAAIGKDYSGNGNNWTPNNISVTAGATYDSMLDVPTQWADGGNGRGNYAVLNPLNTTGGTLSAANLNYVNTSTTTYFSVAATMALKGKIYWEVTVPDSTTPLPGIVGNGILPATGGADVNTLGGIANGYGLRFNKTEFRNNNTTIASGLTSYSDGAVLAFAYDSDTGKLWYAVNNTWQASGDPAAGTNPIATTSTTIDFFPAIAALDSGSANFNFGQRPFAYTPPSGFRALNTFNLPEPAFDNGALYMTASLYTGTGANLTVTNTTQGVTFQPDFVWIKGRSGATDHALYDAVRGTQNDLVSNSSAAATTQSTGLTAFNSNGFTVGTLAKLNTNTATYVAWQWNAGGSNATNTSGSITSTVRASTTSGFSVVTYTGTGANATVGHGLGVAPRMIIVKSRSLATDWPVYHASLTAAGRVFLNGTNAYAADSAWNSTAPTSSVFSIGPTGFSTNNSGQTYVAYCFAAIAGYSAFGSYTGNGSADGPFVFLGFRPRWVLIKASSGAADWVLVDSVRQTYNVMGPTLFPNLSSAEATASYIDFTSNGFKIRTGTAAEFNNNTSTYIYAAFAENPFKYSLAR